jgi:peptidoglycan/LPS O-acetylase OafA/YrhL
MNSSPTNNKLRSGYIGEIDGLRAIAVLLVILFHFKPELMPGGFSGVDIFFVISGYVVSGSLMKYRDTDFWSFATNFYARRILRIYPALVVCLVVTSLVQTLLVPPSWLSTTSNKTAISAFFGLSNFSLIWFSDGYFSPRVEFNAFTHTWSLAVEEQFYLIFPVIFFIWRVGHNRQGRSGIIANLLLPLLVTISLLFSAYQTSWKPELAYYLLPSRFWELGCGAILFVLHTQGKLVPESRTSASVCIFSGLIFIGLGSILSDPLTFPFPWALLPVIGSLLVIVGSTTSVGIGQLSNSILNNNFIVYIGKISYSLYLWHWPIVVIFRWTVGLENQLMVTLAIVLTILTSLFSYHYVECPIRKNRFVITKSDGYIVSRGAIAIVTSTLIAIGIFLIQPYVSLSVTKDRWNWYPYAEVNESRSSYFQSSSSLLQNHKLYVLGDSHTGAYSTMLQMLRNDRGMSVQQFSKGGCAIANLIEGASPDCIQFAEEVVSKIKAEATAGDIVLLASLRANRLGDQWATFDELEVERKQFGAEAIANRATALKEASAIISSLEMASLIVIIDAPKPVFRSPPFRCSDWFNADNPVCKGGSELDRDFLLKHREPIMEQLEKLASRHKKLVVWDPFPILCPDEICMTSENGRPIYFDGDHLSGHGNRVLYPSFLSLLDSVEITSKTVLRLGSEDSP